MDFDDYIRHEVPGISDVELTRLLGGLTDPLNQMVWSSDLPHVTVESIDIVAGVLELQGVKPTAAAIVDELGGCTELLPPVVDEGLWAEFRLRSRLDISSAAMRRLAHAPT